MDILWTLANIKEVKDRIQKIIDLNEKFYGK